ncbi:hypothetical protein ANTPLA_LOCUS1752 [Anthophora plagiata]
MCFNIYEKGNRIRVENQRETVEKQTVRIQSDKSIALEWPCRTERVRTLCLLPLHKTKFHSRSRPSCAR